MRRLAISLPVVLALLASCSSEEQPKGEAAQVTAVQLQPILYPDIEAHEIYGFGCSFVPGGGGVGAIAIALPEAGFLKPEGRIVRLAPETGGAETPLGTPSGYASPTWSFRLDLHGGEGKQVGVETLEFGARLTVRGENGAVVYQAEGSAQCGS